MSKDDLILVDEEDCEVGFMEKVACHVGWGKLHRAFSVFIFNSKDELLIQKRAEGKMLWGGFWSNSCCSHPRKGEAIEDAASRRIVEELGIACGLRYVYKFRYAAGFEDVGSEKEVCSVFVGWCDDEPVLDLDEVSEFRWISSEDLFREVLEDCDRFTPWFLQEIEELKKKGEI